MTHPHLSSVIQSVIFSLATRLLLSTVIITLDENVRCSRPDIHLQMEKSIQDLLKVVRNLKALYNFSVLYMHTITWFY